jgi:mono/diheme cytochrome c family protein
MTFRTLAVMALATTLLGCPSEDPTETTDPTDEPSRVDDILALTGSVDDGMAFYTANCQVCHAADGTGGAGPNLNTVVPPLSDEDLATVLIDGVGTMPAYGGSTDQELADVMAYVLQEWGGSTM